MPEVATVMAWSATALESTGTVSTCPRDSPSGRHSNATVRGIRPERRFVIVRGWPTGNSPPGGSTTSPVNRADDQGARVRRRAVPDWGTRIRKPSSAASTPPPKSRPGSPSCRRYGIPSPESTAAARRPRAEASSDSSASDGVRVPVRYSAAVDTSRPRSGRADSMSRAASFSGVASRRRRSQRRTPAARPASRTPPAVARAAGGSSSP